MPRRTRPPRPLIPLEEFGLERPVSIARHLQLKPADTRRQLALIAPVAVAPPPRGPFFGAGTKVVGHLGLKKLTQNRLQQGSRVLVPVEQSLPSLHCVRIRTASEADGVPSFEPVSIGLDLAMTAPDRSHSSGFFPSTGLHVGIDVSRASLEVALTGSEEDASASHTVPNNEDGFGHLLNWLERQTDVGLEKTRKQVHVCLEASGDYQRPAARFLYERLR